MVMLGQVLQLPSLKLLKKENIFQRDLCPTFWLSITIKLQCLWGFNDVASFKNVYLEATLKIPSKSYSIVVCLCVFFFFFCCNYCTEPTWSVTCPEQDTHILYLSSQGVRYCYGDLCESD